MEGASHVFLSVFNIYSLFHVAICFLPYLGPVGHITALLQLCVPPQSFCFNHPSDLPCHDFTCALLFLMCIQSIYKKTNVNKRGSKLKGIKTNRLGPDVAFGPHFHPRFLFRHLIFVLIELTCALLSIFRCFCLSYSLSIFAGKLLLLFSN